MRFSRDRRGQSVVVGTVILFGFLILALSLYQVQVVPQENADVEFEHSQQVEGEFLGFRNAVLSASQTGNDRSTSLKLGTRYPQRTFALNPPPASGRLSTTDPRELRIENATVEGEENVVEYWNNRTATEGAIAFDTRSLRYSPGYNEFRNGPDLVYEHSLAVAEFENSVLSRSGQTAVDGDNRIRLTALEGNVDESGVERTTLDPEALSQSRRSVRLKSTDTDPIVLELPTDVSMDQAESLEQQWRDRLGADVERVSVADETVRIRLSGAESYRLELGKVGLGTDTSAPNESTGYIKKVSSDDGVAVAEVRDRFNNPVEGADVTIDDGSTVVTETTDSDGRVSYEVAADEAATGVDVNMSINGPTEPDWEVVEFTDLGASAAAGGGADQSGTGQGGNSEWSAADTTETISTSGGVWSGIDNVNAIVLSDPRFTPIARDGTVASESRYFRLGIVVGDPPTAEGDTRYTIVFPPDSEGLELEYSESQEGFTTDDNVPIRIIRSDPNSDGDWTLLEDSITNEAFLAWYRDGEELNLLNASVYANDNLDAPVLRERLDEIRAQLATSENQEAYIVDAMGRTNLTLDNRPYPEGEAESLTYNDDATTIGGGNAGVEFSILNTGGETVNIDSVVVESTTSPAATVLRDGTGNGQQVITVSGTNEGSFEVGNVGYSFGEVATLSSSVSVPSGDDATVTLTRFFDGEAGGNNNYVDMSSESVTVTLTLSDGTQRTFTVST